MATKMRRFLAILIALSLGVGHLLVPAIAVEPEQSIAVNVAVSQAPEASSDMNVTSDTTTSGSVDGSILENKTSTTTDWSGTNEDGAAVTGSETIINVTGTDSATGDKLYEGGSITGSETITKTETAAETTVQKDILVSDTTENTHSAEDGDVIITTESSSSTGNKDGQWVEGTLVKGETAADPSVSAEEETRTAIGIDTTLPGNVTIQLDPNSQNGTTITKTISVADVISGAITLPADGSYTELKDENGTVIGYEIVTTTQNSETKVTVSDPTSTTSTRTEAAEVTLPEGVQAGTELLYAEDGTVIGEVVTDIVPTYDDSGKVVKYVITKTTTVNTEDTHIAPSGDPSSQEAITGTSMILPQRPAMSVSSDPVTGITTTVTVADILDENGNVTGYEVTTKKTSIDGTAISTVTEKKYGTLVTTDTTTVTDPTIIETITKSQEVTTEVTEITAEAEIADTATVTTRLNAYIDTEMTQKDYAYVEINGKLYFIYTGSMTVSEGSGHGDTSLMNPIQPMKDLFRANSSLDLGTGGTNVVNNTSAPAEGFKYIGFGVNTNLNISKGSESSDVVQFRLKSADGKEYYAMCIDFNTGIKSGHLYDIQDITSEDYYQQAGSLDVASAEKLRIIALNGYWGTADNTATTDDIGSLDEVKAMLTSYLSKQGKTDAEIKAIVDSLTPGQALSATQAALWKFGNVDGNKTVNENNLVPNGWDESGHGWNKTYTKNEDYLNTEYVYKALLDLANDPATRLEDNEGVEFLDKEDITAGAITVKSKVVSSDEKHANNDQDETNDVYNTDLSFTLGIEPSKLNGDLIVSVSVGGEEIKKVRLAGADDPLLPLGRILKNEDGSYTIPDVELTEGISVNLNLSGTQDLGSGVYIYTSLDGSFNDSQTLITLATGERKVNLDMDMTFSVEEPTAEAVKVEGSKTTGTKTVSTRTDTKTDRSSTTRTNTKTAYDKDFESNGTIQTRIYTDVTVTKVTTEETREERSWLGSWLKTYEREPEETTEPTKPSTPEEPTKPVKPTEPKDPTEPTKPGKDDPGHPPAPQNDDFPIEEPVLEIPDEEVPLANVPKTGDISLIWAICSGLSAGGLILLNRKKED